MNKLVYFAISIIVFISCEEAIDVDLQESEPRLVIEATINVLEDGSSNAFVKLTTTAPFFESEIPVVSDAIVRMIDDSGMQFPFTYTEDGFYTSDLIPEEGVEYTLEVTYEDELYTGTASLMTGASFEFVGQRDDGGFTGKDIELKAYFTDPLSEDNYYLFEGISEKGVVRDVLDDEFFNGNQIFGFYLVEDLEAGDEVVFNLYGIDEDTYNFLFILLQQTSDQSDGPFETQPATVRGNIVNRTDADNFPLGHFRISEVSTLSYIVQ
ncbi:MAG: DUF4249 domain-containing protein [Flavobacteriaceae bacterium]|nr:DUF4249 domain-containing protein [Flavobacteriaceae bacterium]